MNNKILCPNCKKELNYLGSYAGVSMYHCVYCGNKSIYYERNKEND